jgi:hypothetical protein
MSAIRTMPRPVAPETVRRAVRHAVPALFGLVAFAAGLLVAAGALARLLT